MLICQLVRIWSLFLSILLASKYLQLNFEVPGVKGSLSVGLISTVLERRCFCFWREIHLPIPASDFLARADTVIAAELSGVSHF